MNTIEVRIKRQRTKEKDSTLEKLEDFACCEGRTTANCLEWILEGKGWESWVTFREIGRAKR